MLWPADSQTKVNGFRQLRSVGLTPPGAAWRSLGRGPCRVHPGALFAEPRLHDLVARLGAVVPGAEPLVERHGPVGIVYLEVLVVEVTGEGVGADGPILAGLDPVEADMADDGAGAGDLEVVEQQHRMRRKIRWISASDQ